MTCPGTALIVVLLDRSGSMELIREATISGYNKFLDEQRKAPGAEQAWLTFVQFDDESRDTLQDMTPVAIVRDLSWETFVPRGQTPLLDAMGKTISEVGAKLAAKPERNRPEKVIFVIITDGQENASKEYTRAQVFTMIKHQQEKYAWEFIFLAANQDAITTGMSYGIPAGSSLLYNTTPASVGSTFGVLSDHLINTRSTGASVNFTDQDRIKAYNPDAGPGEQK